MTYIKGIFIFTAFVFFWFNCATPPKTEKPQKKVVKKTDGEKTPKKTVQKKKGEEPSLIKKLVTQKKYAEAITKFHSLEDATDKDKFWYCAALYYNGKINDFEKALTGLEPFLKIKRFRYTDELDFLLCSLSRELAEHAMEMKKKDKAPKWAAMFEKYREALKLHRERYMRRYRNTAKFESFVFHRVDEMLKKDLFDKALRSLKSIGGRGYRQGIRIGIQKRELLIYRARGLTQQAVRLAKGLLKYMNGEEKLDTLNFLISKYDEKKLDPFHYIGQFLETAVGYTGLELVKMKRDEYIWRFFRNYPVEGADDIGSFYHKIRPLLTETMEKRVIPAMLQKYAENEKDVYEMDAKSFVYKTDSPHLIRFDETTDVLMYNKDFCKKMEISFGAFKMENTIAKIWHLLQTSGEKSDTDGDWIPDKYEKYFSTKVGKKEDLRKLDIVKLYEKFERKKIMKDLSTAITKKEREKARDYLNKIWVRYPVLKSKARKYWPKFFFLYVDDPEIIPKKKNWIRRYKVKPALKEQELKINNQTFSVWFDRHVNANYSTKGTLIINRSFGADLDETTTALRRANLRAYCYHKLRRLWGNCEIIDRRDYNGDSKLSPDTYKNDRDGDWLPDSLEDVNNNGKVDIGETDPYIPDTNGDGIPDVEQVDINELLKLSAQYRTGAKVAKQNLKLAKKYYQMGRTEYAKGNYKLARTYYEKAIFFDNKNTAYKRGLERVNRRLR